MVGAIIFAPTGAPSEEPVVGLAQRVVVARAGASRDAAVQHSLEYPGSEHLEFELEGGARSVVEFEGVLPEAAPCVAYALVDLDGQVGTVVDVPPRYTASLVWLFTWSAASTLIMAVDSVIPLVCKDIISVLDSDTLRLNVVHMTTITPIIFLSFSGDTETTPSLSAQSMPQSGVAGTDSLAVAPPRPPQPPPAPSFFLRYNKASMMSLSALKHAYVTFITATNKMLNRRGTNMHP